MEQKVDDANVRHQEDQNQTVLLWLSTLQFREQQVAILESLEPGTGEWFIRHETVQSWLDGKVSLLWCPGLREFPQLSARVVLTWYKPVPERRG
jgi:hypothetical protein